VSLDVRQGTLSTPAATGSQTYSFSSALAAAPKAIIFWTANATSAYTAGIANGVGFVGGTTASTDQRAAGLASDDNVATTNTGRGFKATAIAVPNSAGGAYVLDASLTAWTTTGFTLNWAVTPGSGRIVHYLALGGSDLTNAKVGQFAANTGAGNQAVGSVGFQPDCVLLLTIGHTAAATTGTAQLGLGAAMSTTQRWATFVTAGDAQTMTANVDAMQAQRTDSLVTTLSISATQNSLADFVSFDTDGFTINWSDPPSAAILVGYLALKGGSYDVGAFSKVASPSTDNDVTVGFTPKAVLLHSWSRAASTSISANCEQSFGASIGGGTEGCMWHEQLDATLNTSADRVDDATKALRLANGPSTTVAEADLDLAAVANGFRASWTTNDATGSEVLYLAVGDTPAAGSTGTAALTLPALDTDATGTYDPPDRTGTAALTLPALDADATGAYDPPDRTGTSALTLPALDADAAGTVAGVERTGTVALTLPALDADAAGTYAPPDRTGTAALTLPVLDTDATGTYDPPDRTGTAALTLPSITVASDGTYDPPDRTGTAALALPPITVTATGTYAPPNRTGTGALALPALDAAAAGTYTPPNRTGTAALTLPALDGDAAGTSTLPPGAGAAALTLPALTAAATGTYTPPNRTGTVALTLPALTGTAAGTYAAPNRTGALALVLPGLETDAVGTAAAPGRTGTVALTLPVLTLAAAGATAVPTRTGTAALVLPLLTVAAVGTHTTPGRTGTLALTLPALTLRAVETTDTRGTVSGGAGRVGNVVGGGGLVGGVAGGGGLVGGVRGGTG
jgi:hypothetical protein